MGFHPNDKMITSHPVKNLIQLFLIFLLDKVKYWFYTVCSWKRKYSVFDMKIWISLCDVRRIYANINSFLLYN